MNSDEIEKLTAQKVPFRNKRKKERKKKKKEWISTGHFLDRGHQ